MNERRVHFIKHLVLWLQHNEQVNETSFSQLTLRQHGLLPHWPYILPNLTDIVRHGDDGLVGYYVCDRNAVDDIENATLKLPYLCDHSVNGSRVNVIKFRVKYEQGDKMLPFGEIQYNYALLAGINASIATHDDDNALWNSDAHSVDSLDATIKDIYDKKKFAERQKKRKYYEKIQGEDKVIVPVGMYDKLKEYSPEKQYISGVTFHGNVTEQDCYPVTTALKHDWSLLLLVTRLRRDGNVKLQSPWILSCTTPYIRHNGHIQVC